MSTSTELIGPGTCLLKRFDPRTMEILKWLNSFEYIVDVMKIKTDEKVEFLFKNIEPFVVQYIESKVFPENPRNLSYDELILILEILFSFWIGEHAANYRFSIRNQFIGESVPEYVLSLRKIASKGSSFLRKNESLTMKFIKGLQDEKVKEYLSGKTDLTLAKAVATARQAENHKIWIEMMN